jgi:DNA-binding XRE family transcriptional regulator
MDVGMVCPFVSMSDRSDSPAYKFSPCSENRAWLGYRLCYPVQEKTVRCSELLPVQCKMARAALGLGVRELATAADVSPETVVRFEGGETLRTRTVAAIRIALEGAGVDFIAENGGGAGVRLRKPRDSE